MKIRVLKTGDTTEVTPVMETLDCINAKDFKQRIEPLLLSNQNLVLDLGRIQVIDSAGLAVILACLKHVQETGGEMKLRNMSRSLERLCEMARVGEVLETTGASRGATLPCTVSPPNP